MSISLFGLVEVAILGFVAWLITRSRSPELKRTYAELPKNATARRELLGIVVYAIAAQVVGAALGTFLGWGPISFHLAGSLHTSHESVAVSAAIGWAAYNLLVYVALPLMWMRRRYSRRDLWLTSRRPGNDLAVILTVLSLESAVQIAVYGEELLALSPEELIVGGLLAFSVSFVGTVLPTLVIVAALIVPRLLAITRSPTAAVIGGGVAYAALHTADGWTDYSSIPSAVVSFSLVFITYFGPGALKAYLTLRTTNAWVHAWAYHAVAPHLWADAPMFARMAGFR
ncbi:hypothetical protein [Microbacterium sp. SLBN-154]|uniref:hypothetical protein n=1 Tax=Microbacterium sp. SLBN-154 TaxID=2768458 RepID=UPI00114F78F1|nr:hypothetical protein [Microbacterium sp. SLBN-154]